MLPHLKTREIANGELEINLSLKKKALPKKKYPLYIHNDNEKK